MSLTECHNTHASAAVEIFCSVFLFYVRRPCFFFSVVLPLPNKLNCMHTAIAYQGLHGCKQVGHNRIYPIVHMRTCQINKHEAVILNPSLKASPPAFR